MQKQQDSGVYVIKNTINGKAYVGSSISIRKRFKNHRFQLTKGSHHSLSLQQDWNTYGESAFEFTVLEMIDTPKTEESPELSRAEFKWMQEFDSLLSGYNTSVFVINRKVKGSVDKPRLPRGRRPSPNSMTKKGKAWSMPDEDWEWLEDQENQAEVIRNAIQQYRASLFNGQP